MGRGVIAEPFGPVEGEQVTVTFSLSTSARLTIAPVKSKEIGEGEHLAAQVVELVSIGDTRHNAIVVIRRVPTTYEWHDTVATCIRIC